MATLNEFNAWPIDKAREELMRCCGCIRWAAALACLRPFKDHASLLRSSDVIWSECGMQEWLEAFSQHPRIGGADVLRGKYLTVRDWAKDEQAGTEQTSATVLDAFSVGNAEYESKFGFIFIVCATGKSAAEMLALLRERLANDAETEGRLAAGEQNKITKIRLEKLLL